MVDMFIETQYLQMVKDKLSKEYIVLPIFQQLSRLQQKELKSKKEMNK